MFNTNQYHTPGYHDEHNYSFQYITPNSRKVPAPSPATAPNHHTNNNDNWRQPARTSSLQQSQPQLKTNQKQLYHDRESLIDPAGQHGYSARETYIEPNMSTFVIDPAIEDYYVHNIPLPLPAVPSVPAAVAAPVAMSTMNDTRMNYFHQDQQHHQQDPQIQTVISQPKSVKSNVQHIVNSSSPIQVQHAYVEVPQPSVAVYEQTNSFSLQPVPLNKKVNGNNSNNNNSQNITMKPSASTSSNRLPKPPLTPLVIPPTPIRSSSSPNSTHFMATTPTRTSSMQQNSPNTSTTLSTPGGLSTPGSSRSANSPMGLSPFYSPSTPSPNTLLPHTTLPSPLGPHSPSANNSLKRAITTTKKLSMQPENEAERLVHEGIKFHEAGKLEQATDMFKQASILNLPIAMFLYGVSLRHGWGCKRNEHLAFQYLQKAAEHAVEDLNNFSNAVNASASKGELIMAIYELGVSFRHGWGCKKNKETAVYYFKIAADLNDADAQNDLGHCYYHGHGVKKDLFMAAKYYRKADKQGQGIMGNSWIWKSKYDAGPPSKK
ncbi:AAA ATPase [Mucor velutinosus]|uniref:AAA ATPase n=1 Tax=Mucor velutinosus TaxID=708070 RepID=A0AAN7DJR1_9FUNG|nr:AAA ATPase [Mucor velutinosus]